VKRLLALILLCLASCTTPSQSLKNMYANSLREREGGSVFDTLGDRYQANQERRLALVRQYLAEEEVQSSDDYLYAGALLSTSPYEEDLIAAQMSGLKAAEMGEDRGFRVAAESIDRYAMHVGKPQRYGTQFYYVEVIEKWRLYPVDPRTTDAERKAMGIEPLAELLERTELLNEKIR